MKAFKLTKGRKKELEICKYFYSLKWHFSNYNHKTQSGKNIFIIKDKNGPSSEEAYFNIQERGLKEIRTKDPNGVLRLIAGRIWADRSIHELWEPSLYCQSKEGILSLYELFGGYDKNDIFPDSVAEYVAKKICGGFHYQQLMEMQKEIKEEWEHESNN